MTGAEYEETVDKQSSLLGVVVLWATLIDSDQDGVAQALLEEEPRARGGAHGKRRTPWSEIDGRGCKEVSRGDANHVRDAWTSLRNEDDGGVVALGEDDSVETMELAVLERWHAHSLGQQEAI